MGGIWWGGGNESERLKAFIPYKLAVEEILCKKSSANPYYEKKSSVRNLLQIRIRRKNILRYLSPVAIFCHAAQQSPVIEESPLIHLLQIKFAFLWSRFADKLHRIFSLLQNASDKNSQIFLAPYL